MPTHAPVCLLHNLLPHQATSGAPCGTNLVHQGPTGPIVTTTTGGTAVAYSDLAAAGWGVLPKRPRSTDDLTALFGTPDFWSVMCNSNGNFMGPDRKTCVKSGNVDLNQGPLGATHIRYDCDTLSTTAPFTSTFWILT